MTPEDKAKVEVLIADLADDFRPVVQSIEKKIPTTRGHYGSYLSFYGFAKGNRAMGQVILTALIAAGANRQGAADAFKLSFGQ